MTPRSVCQGYKTRVSIILLPTFVGTLTKNDPYASHSSWLCGSRLQSGIIVVLQLVHWVSPPPPVGDIPSWIRRPEEAATTFTSLEMDNLRLTVIPSGRAHARTPSPLRTNRPDASACRRTPNVSSRRRRAEPSPRVRMDCRVRTEPAVFAAPPAPDGVSFAPPLNRAADLAPAVAVEDADTDAVAVADSDHPYTEGRHPAKVEWIQPTKQRTPLQRRARRHLRRTRIGRRRRSQWPEQQRRGLVCLRPCLGVRKSREQLIEWERGEAVDTICCCWSDDGGGCRF